MCVASPLLVVAGSGSLPLGVGGQHAQRRWVGYCCDWYRMLKCRVCLATLIDSHVVWLIPDLGRSLLGTAGILHDNIRKCAAAICLVLHFQMKPANLTCSGKGLFTCPGGLIKHCPVIVCLIWLYANGALAPPTNRDQYVRVREAMPKAVQSVCIAGAARSLHGVSFHPYILHSSGQHDKEPWL